MRTLLALFLLATSLFAQETVVGRITTRNRTDEIRDDVIRCVLPFPQGEYSGGPLSYLNAYVHAEQFGPSWPDGSWRTAKIYVPVRLGAQERREMDITNTAHTSPTFTFGSGVTAEIGNLVFALRVGGSDMVFGGWQIIDSTPYSVVQEKVMRHPTKGEVWARCKLEYVTELDHVRFWLSYGTNDPTTNDKTYSPGAIQLVVLGAEPRIRHSDSKELARSYDSVNDITVIDLCPAATWNDGESQTIKGVLPLRGRDSTQRRSVWTASGPPRTGKTRGRSPLGAARRR